MTKKIDEKIQESFKKIFIDESKQRIVAKGLIEDNKLFSRLHKIIVPNAFCELNVRVMMGEVMKYYDSKGKVPSYDILEILLMEKAKNQIEREEFIALLNVLKEDKTLSYLHDIKEHAIDFFKQQATVKLGNKISRSVETGYSDDKLRALLDEAKDILVPTDNDLGSSPADHMEEIFNDEDTEKVSTGYLELDAILGGGLQKGNVGLLVAQTGAGKTTFSTAMAVQAAIKGYKVLQIVFEELEKDIIKKQYACLSKDYISNMSKNRISEQTKAEVRKWMPIISDRIVIKRMANQKTTWEEVENYIFNLIMVKNFDPDIIFIDYFDCLKHTTDMRLTQVQAGIRCIKKIDDFAKTTQKALWVMQQSNRQGAQAASKDSPAAHIQGTYAVQQTTAVNMFLTKTEEEKSSNKASLEITKNRQGCIGSFESFYFNNGTLQIDMSTATRSTDVEKVTAEFNAGKQKNWPQVSNELQNEYKQSQQSNVVCNSHINKNSPINNDLGYDIRNDWPEGY